MERKYTHDAEDLTTAVFTCLGAASACWDNLQGAGTFESRRAKEIGDELMAYIEEHYVKRS